MKTAKDYLDEANAQVPRIPAEEAIKKHGSDALFVDVRDSGAIAKTGKIKGIRFSTLIAICDALDCQPGELFEFRRAGDAG